MINVIKKMFGLAPKPDYKALVNAGAKIVDVRTKEEYNSGHIKGSLNIPLKGISGGFKNTAKENLIITCCASGIRSGVARSQLKSMGYKNVWNGGSWIGLNNKLK